MLSNRLAKSASGEPASDRRPLGAVCRQAPRQQGKPQGPNRPALREPTRSVAATADLGSYSCCHILHPPASTAWRHPWAAPVGGQGRGRQPSIQPSSQPAKPAGRPAGQRIWMMPAATSFSTFFAMSGWRMWVCAALGSSCMSCSTCRQERQAVHAGQGSRNTEQLKEDATHTGCASARGAQRRSKHL